MSTALTPDRSVAAGLPPWLAMLISVACGLIAANVYYAQPLAGPISASLGMSAHAAGLIVTMTQVGYAAGLLLIVPLGDLVENRRLVVAAIGLATAALLAAAWASQAAVFLAAALFIGVGSVAVQVLLPYAAHLAPEARRGAVMGNIMGGLMMGIMLARPVSSMVADLLSWPAVFVLSAGVMATLAAVLRLAMPPRQPAPGLGYAALLRSMATLALHTPVLQRRALYHACLFATFSLFWTTAPLLLAGPFHMSQRGIALFALAGVAGVVAAPLAGRAADRGWTGPATGASMLVVAAALLVGRLGGSGATFGVAMLLAAAILLDFGVTAHLILAQRAIFGLGAERRARLNGLFMATFFLGGAVGSAVGGWAYATGGWSLALGLALALPGMALAAWLAEAARGAGAAP